MPLPAHPTERDLVRLMQRVDFRANRGALIGARDLRRAAGPMPKAAFDWLAVSAAKKQLISLHEHDYPSSLTAEQRAELVELNGRYFIGMAIRQSF